MKKQPIAFKQPASRTDAAVGLDDWVKGDETPAAASQPRPVIPEGKIARLTIDLPAGLHAQFKAACALHNTNMVEEVRGFIEKWTRKHR
jgi:ParG